MVDIRTFPRGEVVAAERDTTAADLASRMAEEGVGSIVITEDDQPIGIVTDRDLTVEVLAGGEDPTSVTAEDVMTEDPVTADLEAGIFEVLSRMEEAAVRRVPAVDDDGKVVGIVSFDDFVALFGRELEKLGNIAEAESPAYE
ncbi:CBS domain-containing protein [Halalkalicoccus ordinarius]|uniref:CBS domain-containing protein n=1 Tax=Halalkalicoccus ordinarius TaxID=3116651 RepID=UPI00300E778C